MIYGIIVLILWIVSGIISAILMGKDEIKIKGYYSVGDLLMSPMWVLLGFIGFGVALSILCEDIVVFRRKQ